MDELAHHTQDHHLHVIAPPGSGKTILGLEVARRLNRPTLILTPTISIRNQWIQRFTECFLPAGQPVDWISRSVKEPRFLTVATYQSLYAACSGLEEVLVEAETQETESEKNLALIQDKKTLYQECAAKLLKDFKALGIETLVVDEAHHLQNEWWKSLDWLRKQLGQHVVVALTATPPYDVTGNEWKRYTELCGAVDAEITVPELVVEGDLCPHQDYVYFSLPSAKEAEKLRVFHQRIGAFFEEITRSAALTDALASHRFFVQPQDHLESIYENPAYYSSLLIYLHATDKEIPISYLEIIGNEAYTIPPLSFEWLEILLTHWMYKDNASLPAHEKLMGELERKLKNCGALDHRKISFRDNEKTRSLLSSSISKLNSIVEIAELEYQGLQDKLRMVVLTDFIRKEMIPRDHFETLEVNKMGVFPIFETLRRTGSGLKLGVLTGSFVIIPRASLSLFQQIISEYHAENESIETEPLKHESAYLLVKAEDRMRHHLVHLVTVLFERGGIQVLIGTKSLLGEGWDAPCINALIIASFVGSYVSSNQMRGRAIRTDQNHPQKTGNIWHLVCVDPDADNGGQDLDMLQRRFKSFTGLSFGEKASIENGIGRLNIPLSDLTENRIGDLNETMKSHALERDRLKQQWTEALQGGKGLIEAIKIPYLREEQEKYGQRKVFHFRNTTRYAFYEATLGLGYFAIEYSFNFLRQLHLSPSENLQKVVQAFLIGFGVYYGPKLYRAFRLYLKHGAIEKQVAHIGLALLETLLQEKLLQTSAAELSVWSEHDGNGTVYCHLKGGSSYEQSLFNRAMQEILGNVDNPRYLLIRKNHLFDMIRQQDYHAVPQLIGNRKASAELFAAQWQAMVGDCELVYTRSPEGRKVLLTARVHSLSAAFQQKTEQLSRWE